jgi:RHS repeat-associated protein
MTSGMAATYSYLSDSDLISQVVTADNSRGYASTTRSYEDHRDLLTSVQNEWYLTAGNGSWSPISTYGYTNDDLGRRTRITRSEMAFVDNPHYEEYVDNGNDHGYSDRNELQRSYYYTGTPEGEHEEVPANDFAYDYDPIGNRTDYTAGQSATTTYTTNNRNQYTATANPTESFGYDNDGNLWTTDASGTSNDWTYTWDAENRLSEARKTTAAAGAYKVQCAYDYLGRRVEKKVYAHDGSQWGLLYHRKYVWDGWKLLEELNGLSSDALVRKYTWGLDLAGLNGSINSLEAAGTIGGLLAHEDHAAATTRNFVYFYDGHGNVGQLMNLADATTTCWAKYEYDPYGGVRASYENSAYSSAPFSFRFSTKYLETETGLYYFGYRYYSPRLGRWISRDPIGERGGANLYAFVLNTPTSVVDPLGHYCYGTCTPPTFTGFGWCPGQSDTGNCQDCCNQLERALPIKERMEVCLCGCFNERNGRYWPLY